MDDNSILELIIKNTLYFSPKEVAGYAFLAKIFNKKILTKYQVEELIPLTVKLALITNGTVVLTRMSATGEINYARIYAANELAILPRAENLEKIELQALSPSTVYLLNEADYLIYQHQYESSHKMSQLVLFLQKTRLFGSMSDDDLSGIIPYFSEVTIKEGDILFSKDDPSDSLYLVMEGKLQSYFIQKNKQKKILSTLRPTDSIGELGIVSKKPRALSVEAIENSKLLKLPASIFQRYYLANSALFLELTNYLSALSHKNLAMLLKAQHQPFAALIQNCGKERWDKFLAELKLHADNKINFLSDKYLTNQQQISQLIQQHEMHLSRVVFIIHDVDSALAKYIRLEVINTYVVCDRNEPIDTYSAEKICGRFPKKKSIVLLHQAGPITESMNWLSAFHTKHIHHIMAQSHESYKRLIRFLLGKAIGVVLSGGGARSWAEVGVLKALIENNIPIDAIGGTSAGSVVAATYALKKNYQDIEATYREIIAAIYPIFNFKNLTMPIMSLVNAKKGTLILEKTFAENRFEDLSIPCFAITCNLNTKSEVMHRTGLIWHYLRASIAIPGIVPPLTENGQLYVDGGIINNNPVDSMRTILDESGYIISVNLFSMKEDSTKYNVPLILSMKDVLLMRFRKKNNDYHYMPLAELLIRSLQVGASSREKLNNESADLLILPDVRMFSLLNMNLAISEQLINIGYHAAIEKLREANLLNQQESK